MIILLINIIKMLDYYFDDFKEYYYKKNNNKNDDDDEINEYCDNRASEIYYIQCLEIINEKFGDPLEAIKSYLEEYGEIPIYNNDIGRTHHILAFHAMNQYIKERLKEEEEEEQENEEQEEEEQEEEEQKEDKTINILTDYIICV
jgi:hypothetical protein